MRNCGPFLNSRLCAYTVVGAPSTGTAPAVAGAAVATVVVSPGASLRVERRSHATKMRIAMRATRAAGTTDRRISIRKGFESSRVSAHELLYGMRALTHFTACAIAHIH